MKAFFSEELRVSGRQNSVLVDAVRHTFFGELTYFVFNPHKYMDWVKE